MNSDLENIFKSDFDRYLSEWKEFLMFSSISMETEYMDHCVRCAGWLSSHLESMGLSSRIIETSAHPLVFAVKEGDPSAPTILYYGHYDVQPVDPLDAWQTPPFEPEVRDNRMYARGAQDNKGQVFYSVKALEALLSTGTCRPTIKVLIEGDEEFGSKGIAEKLPELKDELQADLLLVTDTGTVSSGAPTIIMGLRGILHLSLRLQGPGHDLHSGAHGGAVANPATEICRLLARLHNDTGQVAVKGFYDNVREPSSQEKELANAGFNESEYVSETGIQPLAGEQNYSPAERIGMRPCIDVNGVSAGYSGPGIKTVIPDHAEAKVSARLVPDQDPGRCTRLIMDHLREHTPPGMELTVPEHISAGGALRIDPNSEYVSMAQHVLESLTGRETAFRWEGASVPIVAALAETSGAEPLLVGFGSQEDNVHAPNESFSLDRFKQGFMYIGSIIRSAAEKNA